ncbi:MAG TPA: molybdopterin biosynthesis protein [Anaerolineae bacterium]|nr:molybdopterin biosynthesis protein [Anaerolineae bacterium]
MNRKVYLEDIPLDEAWRRFIAALESASLWRPLDGEEIPVADALGRVTAEPIWARVSSPAYHAAAMDGYAVRSEDTIVATETAPVRLAIGVGGDSRRRLQAQYVDTGDPLPAWADAVIPIEHVHLIHQPTSQPTNQPTHRPSDQPTIRPSDQATTRLIYIEILASVAPWSNVRSMGEDMVATELVLPANHTLRPVDLGAIAGCGYAALKVRRKPRVAIIPTGTELITAEQSASVGVKPGDIIEYNSIVLAAEVEQWGGLPTRYPIVPDDYDLIKAAMLDAAPKHDLVLVNAGSSAGSEDYTARIVEELGSLLVHGVAVRPGHPVILGILLTPNSKLQTSNSKLQTPIMGIPGYPVSAALTGEIFVEPLLAKWRGQPPLRKPTMKAAITRKLLSPMGEDEWVRVTVGRVGDRVVAAPLSRGAGVISSLVRADGIVRIPRFSEGVNAGDEVTVELYAAPDEIERTIVHIGSHDLTLDLLAQFLAEKSGRRFVSANAGSLGGLIALRRGEAHLAGSHLLDPETGEYNVSYVKQYLPDTPVVLVTLLRREQGLIVAKGNPKRVESLADLARPDVRFVNRQRGAGTRVLLDYRLGLLGIAPEQVRGYEREEYTHLAVAAAVQSGVADCGLGVRAAARALDLDFVPVEWERYDLVIPQPHYESELLMPMLELLHSEAFRQAVVELPGYDPSPMGTLIAKIAAPGAPGS